jgi:hypothetical protein
VFTTAAARAERRSVTAAERRSIPVPTFAGAVMTRSRPTWTALPGEPASTLAVVGDDIRMPDTISCAAELTVGLPQSPALALFTPEGERAWAAGWDPVFPVPTRTEGPGAVFVTAHREETTIWIMVDQDDRTVRYARATTALSAGTVAVTALDATSTSTRLRVSYDLTALNSDGSRWLETFAADFNAYIAHWEAAIAAALPSNTGAIAHDR